LPTDSSEEEEARAILAQSSFLVNAGASSSCDDRPLAGVRPELQISGYLNPVFHSIDPQYPTA
jgi:hypothetical protein